MWLNSEKISQSSINAYQKELAVSCPNYVVIDGLFNESKLDQVFQILEQVDGSNSNWKTQKHTYSELYVDNAEWQKTSQDQRFVQRDVWQRTEDKNNQAQAFLTFLRGEEFMSLLSTIFNVELTDITVEEPAINTNYFRLNSNDFIQQHADDSPGREVCMLLYLNKNWNEESGGEICFAGKSETESGEAIKIAPLYNRIVLFDPSSKGSEHWVKEVKARNISEYRYNVTSWYWSV